jgi:hypothetical protein
MFDRILGHPKTTLCGLGISILQYVAASEPVTLKGVGMALMPLILGLFSKDN